MYSIKIFDKNTLQKIYDEQYTPEGLSLIDNIIINENTQLFSFIIRQSYPFTNPIENLYSSIKEESIFEIRDNMTILYRFRGKVSAHKIISQSTTEVNEIVEIAIYELIYSIKTYKEELLSGQR